jgi:hypothetical protein
MNYYSINRIFKEKRNNWYFSSYIIIALKHNQILIIKNRGRSIPRYSVQKTRILEPRLLFVMKYLILTSVRNGTKFGNNRIVLFVSLLVILRDKFNL